MSAGLKLQKIGSHYYYGEYSYFEGRGTFTARHPLMTATPRMVKNLLDGGWIYLVATERLGSYPVYGITEKGKQAVKAK